MANPIFIARQDTLEEIGGKVDQGIAGLGQTADAGGSETAGTAMAKLNALMGRSTNPFKSWKRYTYANSNNTVTKSIDIEPVDPERCIVLVERLYSYTDTMRFYDFTLSATAITVTHNTALSEGQCKLAFTVIELY